MWLRLLQAGVWLTVTVLTASCSSVSGPTVHPENVLLEASVRHSDITACSPDVQWILEVELDRTTALPLYTGERQYMYEMNVFDGERPLGPNDYGEGCDKAAGDFEAYHVGNDGRTYSLAVRAAHKSGDLPATYLETQTSATGFTYVGSEFPVKVRYYLKDRQPPRKIAVVYSHYEMRFGKDYSWTKTVYAEQPTK